MHNMFNMPNRLLGNPNDYIHFWFWVCGDLSEPFVIMSMMRYDVTGATVSEGSNLYEVQYFSIGMNADGNFYIELQTFDR